MNITRQQFRDLGRVIDEAHALFTYWESAGIFSPLFDADKVQLMKLAVHEWLANLVQHADFSDRPPEIQLHIIPNGKRVRCVIEDNSAGFDLEAQIQAKEDGLGRLPERGMGLLMLRAATEELHYHRGEDGTHRLEFSVLADDTPWLNIPY